MKLTPVRYIIKMLCLFTVTNCVIVKGMAQKMAVAYHRNQTVFINLMKPSADSLLLIDGTAAMYSNEYSDNVDQYDAAKLPNIYENICLSRDGENLAVEARSIPKQNDTLFINLWGLKQTTYDLQIKPQGMPATASIGWLIDNYLHTKTSINFFSKTLYSFLVSKDSDSYQHRFMIFYIKDSKFTNYLPVESISTIKIFPNPVSGNNIGLQFNNMSKNVYKTSLSNNNGQILFTKNITHNGENSIYYFPLNNVLVKGLYNMVIYTENPEKVIHLSVLINK